MDSRRSSFGSAGCFTRSSTFLNASSNSGYCSGRSRNVRFASFISQHKSSASARARRRASNSARSSSVRCRELPRVSLLGINDNFCHTRSPESQIPNPAATRPATAKPAHTPRAAFPHCFRVAPISAIDIASRPATNTGASAMTTTIATPDIVSSTIPNLEKTTRYSTAKLQSESASASPVSARSFLSNLKRRFIPE